MKNKKIFLLIGACALLSGCSFTPSKPNDNQDQPSEPDEPNITPEDPFIKDDGIGDEEDEENIEVDIKDDVEITEESAVNNITDLSQDGIVYDDSNKLFTISKAGEFIFKGVFEGNILIDAGDDDKVKLTLNGFTIKTTIDSPIKCVNASELQISLKNGSTNYVYDARAVQTVEDDTQGNGAITSSCDLKVSGKGSLYMVGGYKNGFHTKDDLTIKPEVTNGSKIEIKAVNDCLKGNDSVDIQSGNLVLISTSGNGIVTENTDISSKGNQRGTVSISGGHVDIYSAKDAIDAAYNVDISKVDGGDDPIINIYTSNFSSYSEEVSSTQTSKMYLRTSSSFDSNYYYAVEFMLNTYETTWSRATKINGNDNRYTYFELSKPENATSLKVAYFANNVTTLSEENATAIMSKYDSVNDYYDVAKINNNGSTISISGWTSYQTSQPGGGHGGPGGMSGGNTEKADYSAKGIKADNEINISAGKFFIKTYDDAIHAKYGATFENGESGLGNVTLSGGDFEIYASDDGIHADDTLTISNNATIDIVNSYEGIEGNVINITGGYTKVYSTDDGLNASNKVGKTPTINISGGLMDITAYGQDVDGIDSNGSYSQTGGYVITKGSNGGMSTGLDCDGTAKINGGTFVAFGKTEKTPTVGSNITSYTLSDSYSVGTYKITFGDGKEVSSSTKYSYSSIYVYSDNASKIMVVKID